jgi:hypothetical protein
MAALILAALAISAAAQQQVPFKGTFQGNDNTATHGTIITTGTGIGALVGQLSLTDVLLYLGVLWHRHGIGSPRIETASIRHSSPRADFSTHLLG